MPAVYRAQISARRAERRIIPGRGSGIPLSCPFQTIRLHIHTHTYTHATMRIMVKSAPGYTPLWCRGNVIWTQLHRGSQRESATATPSEVENLTSTFECSDIRRNKQTEKTWQLNTRCVLITSPLAYYSRYLRTVCVALHPRCSSFCDSPINRSR